MGIMFQIQLNKWEVSYKYCTLYTLFNKQEVYYEYYTLDIANKWVVLQGFYSRYGITNVRYSIGVILQIYLNKWEVCYKYCIINIA